MSNKNKMHNGCYFLEHGIAFDRHKITDCCLNHHVNRGQPVIIPEYEGDSIDWKNFFQIKQRRVNRHKKYPIEECRDCLYLGSKEFDNKSYISHFMFSQIKLCNAKCIYCAAENRNNKTCYDVYPIIKDLIDKGFHKPGGEATFQGGEPTLLQNFDKLLLLLTNNGTDVKVNTSGIKYSPAISQCLSSNKAIVIISIDSGTKEKYKEIKFVDKFDKVCENIKQYQKSLQLYNEWRLAIKYIIIPGYNDTIEDVDNWLNLMEELNIKQLVLDIEQEYAYSNNDNHSLAHIYMLYDYIIEEVKNRHFNDIWFYSGIEYVCIDRKTEKYNCQNKRAFKQEFNRTREANIKHNIKYNIPTNKMYE